MQPQIHTESACALSSFCPACFQPNREPLCEAGNTPDTLLVRPVSIMRMNHSVPVESMIWASEHVRSDESSQSKKTPRSVFFTPFTHRKSLPHQVVLHYTPFAARTCWQGLAQVPPYIEPNCAQSSASEELTGCSYGKGSPSGSTEIFQSKRQFTL